MNGKALKKYKSNELDVLRKDYARILTVTRNFIQGRINYEEYISYLANNFNQFGIKFYNRQQCEIILGIDERKQIVNRISNSIYDCDDYLVISVDMVQSSKTLSELEDNINDVSELFKYLTNKFQNGLKGAQNTRLTGDGFLALYPQRKLLNFLHLILEIERIEKNMIDYIYSKNLNIKNDFIRFGVGIDVSKVIILYGKEDIQVGLSINRTTQLSKIHVREKYSKGMALTTLRFVNYIRKWINISDNREEKHNNTDVYYIEKDDIEKVCDLLAPKEMA